MWFGRWFGMGLAGLLASNLFLYVSHHFARGPEQKVAAAGESGPIYFAPDTNLEEVDIAMINRAQHSIDVAMYAFTDKNIAFALRRAAERGVRIRIYRDREQYEEEERHGGSVRSILYGEANIAVRVKSSRELMHEKTVLCDGLLRDGSGNWSVSAARYQDNEISVSNNPELAHAFAVNFARMWSRPDNIVVQ